MPSFVPRILEPYKKREQVERRIVDLRAAARFGATTRMIKAAEKLRAAALALVKAKRHLIASQSAFLTGLRKHPEGASLTRQLANLEEEQNWWSSVTVAEIVEKYAG
jgi:enoyl-CoA hydratase/carnithine racemase